MSIEAVGAVGVAGPAFEPRVQSFLEIAANYRRDLPVDVGVNRTDGVLGSLRPSLDSLVAEQRRVDAVMGSLEVKVRPTGRVGEGEGAEVGGTSPAGSAIEKLSGSMAGLMEVASFMAKILLVNKGVQGLQRVWDTLSKGQ